MMKYTNTPRRGLWTALAVITLAGAMAAPQAALADGKGKGKDGKIPIVIAKPIVTQDPPPKKK